MHHPHFTRGSRSARSARSLAQHTLSATALALAIGGCADLQQSVRETFNAETPRDGYEHALAEAGLDSTAIGRDWRIAAARALAAATTVALPYRETGYLPPEEARAVAIRFTARRGQLVTIDARLDSAEPALAFLELFEAPRDPADSPDRIAHANSGSTRIAFEPRRDGAFIAMLQPELLRGGRYTLEVTANASLAFPVQGHDSRDIGSVFGDPRDGGERAHHGIDIFARRGTPALAAAPGVVTRVRETPIGGRVVWLRDTHGNALYYAHLDSQLVTVGTPVRPGDTLGLVGNTGNARTTPPHLHFGVYRRGEGPVDPYPFVHEIRAEPSDLTVDTAVIGGWLRTREARLRLRAGPTTQSAELATLPRHTTLRVLAGTGDWYRVLLPDGRSGYVAGRLTDSAARPLRTTVLASAGAVRARPNDAAAVMDSVPAGTTMDVLGHFGAFLFVRDAAGHAGWLPGF